MIRISPCSDDMVIIEGHPQGGEIDCDGNNVSVVVFDLETGGCSVINLVYADNQWMVEVCPHDPGGEMVPCSIYTDDGLISVDVDAHEDTSLGWRIYARHKEYDDDEE